MDNQQINQRIKELRDSGMTWQAVTDCINEEYGLSWHFKTVCNRYKNPEVGMYSQNNENTSITENGEYKTHTADGSFEAQQIIKFSRENINDVDKLMEFLGYSPEQWELVFITTAAIDRKDNESDSGKTCMYNVRYKVKPKLKQDGELKDYLKIAQETFKKSIKPRKNRVAKQNDKLNPDKVLELPGIELHLGKMAWREETGQDYDKNIAYSRFNKIVDKISEIQNKEKCGTALLMVGNDFFNSDTVDATTTKGTPQMNDLRWQKLFKMGLQMHLTLIETLRASFNHIEVRLQAGNHDKMASFYLYMALAQHYLSDEKVHFSNEIKEVQCFRWGSCAIFFGHGEQRDKKYLESIPFEFAEEWGKAKYRELHLGHLHSESAVVDKTGLIIRRTGAPTGTDAWHYQSRFLGAQQKYQYFIWDKKEGLENAGYINFLPNEHRRGENRDIVLD